MAHAARLSLRMQKELKLLLTDPPPGVSFVPSDDGSSMSSLSNIEARIMGPEETAYAGGIFTVRIQIPERYPFQPPNVTFVTPVYHPNIDNGGRICLDILNLPPKGAWQPSLNISTVLTSIGLLLGDPNPDDGLMCEASREYKYNRQVFDQKARSWTEKYAKTKFDGNKMDDSTITLSGDAMESEPSQSIDRDSTSETDTNRKKIRVVGNRLSLRPVAVAEKGCDDHKENMAQTEKLGKTSLSFSQKAEGPPVLQEVFKNEAISDEYLMQNRAPKISNKENEVASGSKSIEIAIVSDSEESDDENERQKRTRLSLLRKRIAAGGRASWRRSS